MQYTDSSPSPVTDPALFRFPIQRPVTADLNQRIVSEIADKERRLAELGITDIELGIEVEFVNTPYPMKGDGGSWRSDRQQIIQSLRASDPKDELSRFREFNAGEVMQWKLYQELGNKLIYRFGKEAWGRGYYDSPGVRGGVPTSETRIAHDSPLCAIRHYNQFLSGLANYTNIYDLGAELAKNHLHISAKKNGANVMNPEHPDYFRICAAMTAGIKKVLNEAKLLFLDFYMEPVDKMDIGISVNHSKFSHLRLAENSIEIRMVQKPGEDHIALTTLLILAGMEYGMLHIDELSETVTTGEVRKFHLGYFDEMNPLHLLLDNCLIKDGRFIAPELLILHHVRQIVGSLVFATIDEENKQLPLRGHSRTIIQAAEEFDEENGNTATIAQLVKEFMEEARVKNDGSVVWPEHSFRWLDWVRSEHHHNTFLIEEPDIYKKVLADERHNRDELLENLRLSRVLRATISDPTLHHDITKRVATI